MIASVMDDGDSEPKIVGATITMVICSLRFHHCLALLLPNFVDDFSNSLGVF